MLKLNTKNQFVLYKLPFNNTLYHLQSDNVEELMYEDIDFKKSLFLCAPFRKDIKTCTVFYEPLVNLNPIYSFATDKINTIESTERGAYVSQCKEIIDSIISDDILNKVILSRLMNISIQQQEITTIIERLSQLYPEAFIALQNTHRYGCWLTVTPELLINHKDAQYHTIALAGTLPISQDWRIKELEEQEMVSLQFEKLLEEFGVNFSKTKPEEFILRHIKHLRTSYTFDDSIDIKDILGVLHPSAAIAGYPMVQSIDIISRLESHDRNLYCGIIGPWGIDGEFSLYINLRCMQIFEDKATLYVGGGITKDSDPMEEWNETELKALTLTQVLQ